MRVYELAETLEVPTDELIDVMEEEFAYKPGSHMSRVEKDMIPDVMQIWSEGKLRHNGNGEKRRLPRSLFRLKIGEIVNISIDKESLFNAFGSMKERIDFWVGMVVLLTSNNTSQEKKAIQELGQNYLEEIDETTDESIKNLNEQSENLSEELNLVVKNGQEEFNSKFSQVRENIEEWTKVTMNSAVKEVNRLRPEISVDFEINWN